MESGVVIDPTLLRSMDVKAEKIESDWKPPSKPGVRLDTNASSGDYTLHAESHRATEQQALDLWQEMFWNEVNGYPAHDGAQLFYRGTAPSSQLFVV
jgi:hypothetical protein